MPNLRGKNGYPEQYYPPDAELKHFLTSLASRNGGRGCTWQQQLEALQKKFGITIKRTKLYKLRKKLDIPSIRKNPHTNEERLQAMEEEAQEPESPPSSPLAPVDPYPYSHYPYGHRNRPIPVYDYDVALPSRSHLLPVYPTDQSTYYPDPYAAYYGYHGEAHRIRQRLAEQGILAKRETTRQLNYARSAAPYPTYSAYPTYPAYPSYPAYPPFPRAASTASKEGGEEDARRSGHMGEPNGSASSRFTLHNSGSHQDVRQL